MSGLPPHLSNAAEHRLWTAIHDDEIATVRDIVEPLVSEPDTDVCQGRRITALHIAARRGMEDLVDRLIEAGANVNQASIGGAGDLVGETPLHEACVGGHASICVKLLAAGASVNDFQGVCRIRGLVRGALAIAAESGHLPIVEALLGAGADPDGTPPLLDMDLGQISLVRPLPVAIASGHLGVASRLIRAGANVDLESARSGRAERTSARQLITASEDAKVRALI